ncbi:LytR family transcriptional regulator [Arthrobacter sp. PAMC25564]|uniref:LCP family protein n=1 Tax=Arthrobacter sp. PAMC25564 TaxID=2565366 RepID=UPI0010A20A2F|nr:LCP family protein [Arthrobacter sp. PAMC25564]QCB97367.1 LytR family transcriptional regulator [Arthrobacter sp. PAMC25564]
MSPGEVATLLGRHHTPGPESGPSAPVPYPGQGTLVDNSRNHPARRRPRWLKITGIAVAVVFLGVVVFGGYWLWRLQSNISSSALGAGGLRTEGPVDDRKDRLQILVLGSDTRSGKNGQYGTADQSSGYGQSDVMMLLDISADNNHVNVISFPRDLLVDVPACTDRTTNQRHDARPNVMINSAMADAGIGCAVDTVNKLTGMEVDHFMMADFNAVKELSNTVGGVEVCVNAAVFDPESGLRLPKGTSQVQGDQALAFLRTRHAFADGGDLGRIKAQQSFLASLTRKLKADGTLGNPQKMLGVADTVTRNLTVDDGLASVPTMLTLADRLKNIDPAKVNFITVPTVPAASDPNRLGLDEPAAGNLFAMLRRSADLSQPPPGTDPGTPSADPSTAAATKPGYDKALQPVTVANGTSVPGRSTDIGALLTGAGYTKLARIQAQPRPQSMVYYGPGFADVAADIAALFGLPPASVQQVTGVQGVQLYAGEDFTSGTRPAPPTPAPSDVVAQTANDQTCQTTNPGG